MDANILTSLVAGLGLGSIATAYVSSWLDKKKQVELNLTSILEDKYRSLLIFMACVLDIKKKKYFTINEQIEQKTSKEYLEQIKEYYYHSVLYSSDEVITALKKFIKSPSQEMYIKVAQAMRNDIWKRNTKLGFDDIKLN